MAKKKFYAVRRGKQTGLFATWDECRNMVNGYSGAEYRGFANEQEALAYLEGGGPSSKCAGSGGQDLLAVGSVQAAYAEDSGQAVDAGSAGVSCAPGQVVAYVDGSFDKKLGRYSFGCVLLVPDGRIFRESGKGDNPASLALRNVSGEMLGAMHAVRWAIRNGFRAIDIRYDYMGIEQWATRGWRAKNELTQKYADYMQKNGERIAITFTKIAAHTGDRYNEEADRLARAALTDGRQDHDA